MAPDPTPPASASSSSDTMLRRLLGGMSFFTMLMTIPQVLTIWFGLRPPGYRCYVERLSCFCRSVVLVRDTETRQEYLFGMRGLDGPRQCCDHRSRYLWISDLNRCP